MTKIFGFSKNRHLCGQAQIDRLFEQGKSFLCFPYRVTYSFLPRSQEKNRSACRVLITVPKKLFHRAVDRNLLRRRTREAYRILAPAFENLLEEKQMCIDLALVYIANEAREQEYLKGKMQAVLEKLQKMVTENPTISADILG